MSYISSIMPQLSLVNWVMILIFFKCLILGALYEILDLAE